MSQSPVAHSEQPDRAYLQAWSRLYALVRDGGSWSGHERNCGFLNTRSGRFADISSVSGVDFPDDSRALASVDWDHDGDLDLWLANRTAPRVRFLRNDTPSNHHFLALRLEGRTCNRDAIGARVEVELRDRRSEGGEGASRTRLIKTLRAGEGFLSQSSKWLHFGLGESRDIERLVIRWPGGKVESFLNLKADRHYQIVQGGGTARPWTRPVQTQPMQPSRPTMPKTTNRAALFLTSRLPLPPIEYETFDGNKVALREHLGAPVLVNLWASWCQPCVSELGELVRQRQKLQRAGLEIIALSVDGLEDGETSNRQSARKLLGRLKFPFTSGYATANLLDKLQIVNNHVFYQHRPLPLPTSLLIDAQGNLAAVYKGPVRVQRVLTDVDNLPLEGAALRLAALPFPGRESLVPGRHPLVPLAAQLLAQGLVKDVNRFISQNAAQLNHESDFPQFLTQLATQLSERGEASAATAHLGKAIELKPDFPEAHVQRGDVHAELGHYEQAMADYDQAIQLNPDDAQAHNNRGTAHERLGRYEQAMVDYERAIALKPDFSVAHNHRGTLYARLRNFSAALRDYQRAIQLRPDYANAYNNRGNIHAQLGRNELALADYDKAVELKADYAEAHYNRGQTYAELGKYGLALKDFQRAIQLQPDDADGYTTLAWLMATCPEAKYRDGPQAISSARKACKMTGWNTFRVLNTLAAAYAEAGQFSEAVRWQTKAMAVAPEQAQAPLRALLELYQAGKPFRQPAAKPPSSGGGD